MSKCIKYVPGKKTAVGDKPAVRRKEEMLDLSRMPLVRGVSTVEEFCLQRATVGFDDVVSSKLILVLRFDP